MTDTQVTDTAVSPDGAVSDDGVVASDAMVSLSIGGMSCGAWPAPESNVVSTRWTVSTPPSTTRRNEPGSPFRLTYRSLALSFATTVPLLAFSVPLCVQPLTLNASPEPVPVSLAVVMAARLIDKPSLDSSDALVKSKLAFLVAVTVPVPAGAESDPVPVQPLTLKVLELALLPYKVTTLIPPMSSEKIGSVPSKYTGCPAPCETNA